MTSNPHTPARAAKKPTIREEDGWLIDDRNNKASISYFGTKEAAERALLSLKECDDCVDCSGCSDCSDCSDCSRYTHCRAGWVITLAGAEGKALESFYNTELAAMMIYDASDPAFKINPARFYDENDAALADMKALAEKEAAQ